MLRASARHNYRRRSRLRLLAVALLTGSLLFLGESTHGTGDSSVLPPTQRLTGTELFADIGSYLTLKPEARHPNIYAKNFLLMDAETGDVLVEQRGDELIPIASTTKMVTALVADELMERTQVITVSPRPPTAIGSKINLRSGEKITLDNLIKGLLIASGNDTAFAIAEAYSGRAGEYEEFIDQMNLFLKRHNLPNSVLADPAGLNDEGRSTARELAHISRLLLQNPYLSLIVQTPQATISSVDGLLVHELKNTNRLIQEDTSFYLPQALGIKTGFTHGAGHSLVGAYSLNGRTIIGVTMNTAEYTVTASAKEMKKLFVWAEQNVVETTY
jgi:serine-type D-Ala-D-Ala carboxypeptidase (penicillin-binding protein 5/6)